MDSIVSCNSRFWEKIKALRSNGPSDNLSSCVVLKFVSGGPRLSAGDFPNFPKKNMKRNKFWTGRGALSLVPFWISQYVYRGVFLMNDSKIKCICLDFSESIKFSPNCVVCAAGYFSDGSQCTACPVDSYKPEVGNDIPCTECLQNTTTNGVVAQTSNTCGRWQYSLTSSLKGKNIV